MHAADMDESRCESSGEDEMTVINITAEQVEGWKTRLQQIDGDIASLTEEKARLQRKLAAVKELEALSELEDNPAGRTFAEEEAVVTAEPADDDVGLSLIDAIPLVARRAQRSLTPKEIKFGLADVGFTRSVGKNYFYTAIQRAVEKGTIAKTVDGRYAVPEAVTNGGAYRERLQ
jgi:hypothetical protein